jgi:alpha-tubulin suppressor-like RCC1 family protein
LGDTTDRNVFTLIPSLNDKNIIAIAAGGHHSLALDSDGKIYGMGFNRYGPLGLGNNEHRNVFTPIEIQYDEVFEEHISDVVISPVTTISLEAGESFTLNATVYPSYAANKAIIWSVSDSSIAEVDENGVVTAKAAGAATVTATSQADNTKFATATINVVAPYSVNIQSIYASGDDSFALGSGANSFALGSDGKVYATGRNNYGQLGLGSVSKVVTFTKVSFLSDENIVAIAAGRHHSIVLANGGKVYATGLNSRGQLGLGDYGIETNRDTFTEVSDLNGKNITALAAGSLHSLALGSDGKVYATGKNEYGQLGLGDKISRNTFTLVPSLNDKNITAIATRYVHSLALGSDGKVYATGNNLNGQLGLGTLIAIPLPKLAI